MIAKAIKIIQKILSMWPKFDSLDAFLRWANFYKLKEKGFQYTWGLTKVCIMHDDLPDWVLKVEIANVKQDYCYLEYLNYCSAKERGLEEYFAETIYLGEFKNTKWTMQKKADVNCGRMLADLAIADPEGRDTDHKTFIKTIFNNEDLISFLEEINALYDLGFTNLGYINNKLVIIDFSGNPWRTKIWNQQKKSQI